MITNRDKVYSVLRESPEARRNDTFLYLSVLHTYYGVPADGPLGRILDPELPTFDSISRERRRIQREYPELMADRTIRKARALKEKEYRLEYGQQ